MQFKLLNNEDKKCKQNSGNVSTQKYNFERQLYAQTQDLQIFKKLYMSRMNPKEFVNRIACSV